MGVEGSGEGKMVQGRLRVREALEAPGTEPLSRASTTSLSGSFPNPPFRQQNGEHICTLVRTQV